MAVMVNLNAINMEVTQVCTKPARMFLVLLIAS